MRGKFVQINGRVLDCAEYQEDFERYGKVIRMDLKEYFKRFGFLVDYAGCKNLLKELKFYNSNLDMEAAVVLKKRSRLHFV